jgi:spore coat protein CotH
LLLALLAAAGAIQKSSLASATAARIETEGLYHLTNIWTVHLTFTPDQWEEMEPKGGVGPFGGPGGPGPFGRGPRGPGQGGPGGGPGGFGPAMFLAPAFLNDGDSNHDRKLSRDEFQALAHKWFASWDTNKSGKLDANKLRLGLNNSFGPRPGGGRPGARGPGMNLQGAEGKRNGLASAMGIEFKYVHAELDFDGITFKDVAVRYKGNGTFMESRNSLKRSLKVDLSRFAKGQKLAGVSKLNFNNNVTDASWMNEVLSYRLYRDAGVPAPQTAYARVYVTVPGKFDHQYFGLYSLVEDVDHLFAVKRFGTRRGAIFKPVTSSLFSDLGNDWAKYKQTYDPKTQLFEEQKARVIEFSQLVTRADDKTFAAKVGEFVDLPEFARFMAVMVFLSDMDGILGPGQNLYLYLHPKTQWFDFIPWDQDHSFGQFGMRGSQPERENLSIQKPWDGENRFLERIYQLEDFQKLYLAAMKEFSKTIFQPDRFQQQVDEIAAVIRPAVAEESKEKLGRFDNVVAGGNIQPMGFGFRMRPFGENRDQPADRRPSDAPDRDRSSADGPSPGGPRFGGPPFGGSDPMKPIKGFVKVRSQSIADQLAGKSPGLTISGFGGRPGGPGGRGPGDFGPGMFLGPAWMQALDTQKKGEISEDDFTRGFIHWFESWNADKSGLLSEEQLRAGIDKDLSPFRGGGPFGGPPAFPGPKQDSADDE